MVWSMSWEIIFSSYSNSVLICTLQEKWLSLVSFLMYFIEFENSNDRVSEEDMVKLGSLVSGVVDRVTTNGVVVYVNAKGYSKGTISTEHLADHHGTEVYLA